MRRFMGPREWCFDWGGKEPQRTQRGGNMFWVLGSVNHTRTRNRNLPSLGPTTEELKSVLHVVCGHSFDQFQQSPHLFAHRILPLAGQNDTGVGLPRREPLCMNLAEIFVKVQPDLQRLSFDSRCSCSSRSASASSDAMAASISSRFA